MKKLTRFPAALLLLAAVFALAVGCTGCTAKARKVYHEKRAEKFYAASQFDRAEIEYLNVLHNDPMDAQAIGRLGLIYYQEGRVETAFPYLLKGSELATNDLDLRLKLGFIYVALGRPGMPALRRILSSTGNHRMMKPRYCLPRPPARRKKLPPRGRVCRSWPGPGTALRFKWR